MACAALAWALAAGVAAAKSPAVDQALRLGDSDPTAALSILEQAYAQGDLEAGAVLGSTLFFATPPRQSRERACAIARRLIDARNGHGFALMSSCVLAGTVAAPDRLEAARDSARRAIALGAGSGGTALFTAFAVDPRFSTQGPDGQADPAKRAALAAEPAAQRRLQAEAWTGLSIALQEGDPMAVGFAIAALAETGAAGNLERLLALAERSRSQAQRFAPQVAAARRLQALGGTQAALRVAQAVQPAALSAAKAAAARDGVGDCEELELTRIEPGGAPADATYLPVGTGPLKDAYLVSGQWEERWIFHACRRDVAVEVAFKADGWGGASFEARPAPRPVVRRLP